MASLDWTNSNFTPTLSESKTTSQPSAIVIGAGLGGLAAAMRLGAKGYRVTVFDKLDVPGGRGSAIWQDGHRFDLGPTIVTVPQVLRDLWTACGRDFDAEVELKALDPYYEIRWMDGSRFVARKDKDHMLKEVQRISPNDTKGYQQFLRDGEVRYLFGFENVGRRSMHKLWDLIKILPTFAWLRADQSVYTLAAKRVKDERLRMALSFHPLFIGGDPFRVTSMYALVNHLETQFGVYYAMGGVVKLAQTMVDVITSQGGIVKMHSEVDEIIVESKKAVGVKLRGGEPNYANVIVSNADVGHTYEYLLRNKAKRRWTGKKLRRKRWSMGLFVWYFGTKGTRTLWNDVGHHTILNGKSYRELVDEIFIKGVLSEDMSLYIHRPSITDPTVAPDGDDTFYVLSPVPHLGHANPIDWKTHEEVYRQRVQDMLEANLLPDLSKHIYTSTVFTPKTFHDRYHSYFGSGFSVEPRIFQSAWFRPHNVSEEFANLYLVGASTHPGAGLPGVISSAEVFADVVPEPELAYV
ncbi:MAG: phytoene desaturase [Aestuariivita sp.]|nr:phytoene desaturase [Aestuariivita sp.]